MSLTFTFSFSLLKYIHVYKVIYVSGALRPMVTKSRQWLLSSLTTLYLFSHSLRLSWCPNYSELWFSLWGTIRIFPKLLEKLICLSQSQKTNNQKTQRAELKAGPKTAGKSVGSDFQRSGTGTQWGRVVLECSRRWNCGNQPAGALV